MPVPGNGASSGKLLLKGSSKIVADYFEFAINSVLFQRGIYPEEDFITVKKWDLQMVISSDGDVREYIQLIMKQIRKWIYGKRICKLVVAIISKSSAETVERWEFDVNIVQDEDEVERSGGSKGVEQIQKEIQAIVRQVTASVTFLPALDDDEYTFNVLVYTDHGEQSVPVEWCDTEDHELEGGVEAVSMRNFKTSIHEVGTTVKYRTS